MSGGESSTSENIFPKSSSYVKDSGELFTLTPILILSPEIKNYGFCLNCVISCFLPILPCKLLLMNKIAGIRQINILHFYFSQVSLGIANLLAVLPLQKLDNDCWVLVTDPVASFKTFNRDITCELLKNGYRFLQIICFYFTRNAYYFKTLPSGTLCV